MNNIKLLLDKYLDGETTLAEEDLLRSFFEKEDIPEELEEYKTIFSGLAQVRQKGLKNNEFDQQILSKIQDLPAEPISINKYFYRIAGIAATLLITVTMLFLYQTTNIENEELSETEVEIIEESFGKIAKYLDMASSELGKIETATRPLEKLEKLSYYDKYNDMIYKYLGDTQ